MQSQDHISALPLHSRGGIFTVTQEKILEIISSKDFLSISSFYFHISKSLAFSTIPMSGDSVASCFLYYFVNAQITAIPLPTTTKIALSIGLLIKIYNKIKKAITTITEAKEAIILPKQRLSL